MYVEYIWRFFIINYMTKSPTTTIQFFSRPADLPSHIKILEAFEPALKELCVVRNPHLKTAEEKQRQRAYKTFMHKLQGGKNLDTYAYCPWKRIAVHLPAEEFFFELRTARNKNIITAAEQKQYRNARVGIVGLSVGTNVVNALVFSGGPQRLKIADFDTIETTNLNRLRAPVFALGMNKAIFAAQQILELDPFAQLEVWDAGVEKTNLEEFILRPRLDIFIDEMDSLDLKIHSRLICKKNRIPVVMVTDNGDNVIVDIERFDKEPNRKILHGLVEGVDPETIASLPYNEWVKFATRIVDIQNLTPRMKESLQSIGKTIAAVPQLGTTATIAGATAAYVVRKILTKQTINSGRYQVKLDDIFNQ